MPRRGLPSLRADWGGVDEKEALFWVMIDGMRKIGGRVVARLRAGPKAAVRRWVDEVCIVADGWDGAWFQWETKSYGELLMEVWMLGVKRKGSAVLQHHVFSSSSSERE